MPSPKSSSNLAHWALVLASAFMAIAGFLGFLGWSSDPSDQKWWALLCSLFGVAGVVVFWKSDAIPDEEVASVTTADDEIKHQSVGEQGRYWKKERRGTLIGALVIAVVLAAVWFTWDVAREYYFLWGYFGLSTLWVASKRWLQIAHELGQLPRE